MHERILTKNYLIWYFKFVFLEYLVSEFVPSWFNGFAFSLPGLASMQPRRAPWWREGWRSAEISSPAKTWLTGSSSSLLRPGTPEFSGFQGSENSVGVRSDRFFDFSIWNARKLTSSDFLRHGSKRLFSCFESSLKINFQLVFTQSGYCNLQHAHSRWRV